MRKRHAPFDQRIEIRRLEHWGAKRMRSIRTMIVGMDVENVRLARMQLRKRRQKKERNQRKGLFHDGVFSQQDWWVALDRKLDVMVWSLHQASSELEHRRRFAC